MSDMKDAYRQIKEANQITKNIRLKSNTELILLHEADFNYKVVQHSEFHITLIHEDRRRLDFWPSTGTARWFEKHRQPGKIFKIGNVEEYIYAHFKRINH